LSELQPEMLKNMHTSMSFTR